MNLVFFMFFFTFLRATSQKVFKKNPNLTTLLKVRYSHMGLQYILKITLNILTRKGFLLTYYIRIKVINHTFIYSL